MKKQLDINFKICTKVLSKLVIAKHNNYVR